MDMLRQIGPPLTGNLTLGLPTVHGPSLSQLAPVVPPMHPMDCGPSLHPLEFSGIDPILGSRLEPMLPPPTMGFNELRAEMFGFSLEFLERLNIKLPLVPKLLVLNVRLK